MKIQHLIHFLAITIIACLSLFFVFNSASAKVSGTCANCHTMHNSQGGADMATFGGETGPNNALTRGSCVGCHSNTTSETIKELGSSRIPVVYNTVPPVNELAGGNFYWVKSKGDEYGHNVLGISSEDESLSEAPGKIGGCMNSCHISLATQQTKISDLGSGCEGCHLNVAHHANDGPSGDYKLVTTAEQGWYRFLSGHKAGDGYGVKGGEDSDWQKSTDLNDHNEYLGKVDSTSGSWGFSSGGNLGHTTTAFCTGCHGLFHSEQTSGGAWIRHPSDAVIPDSGEYSAYTVYNPVVPVARETLPDVPGAAVKPGADMVMCLSCHRPHGSPNSDLLRWDYDTMIAGGAEDADGTGCFVCHTNKDGS